MRTLLKRFGGYSLGLTLGLGLLLMPDLALAQSGGTNDALKNFAEIAATLVHIITAIAMLMIQFFPPLWGSELITGDQVTEMLRPMWIYIRNLTNIAFVGMMLFLAFSNLITSGKGLKDWNIKSKLGPVILGLVAINFSMLAVRVLVDIVHVGTVALLSIADPIIEARGVDNIADYYAQEVDTTTFENCDKGGGANCKSIRELTNSTFCPSTDACLFEIKELEEIRKQANLMNSPEKKNIMLGISTFFMKLESLPMLSADTGGLLDVLDSSIFSLIFGIAYLLALVAMFVVLLVRVVMMWLFTIFSPILVAGWALGIDTGMLDAQFWKYLMVPVKAAGALAFGFVMISALQTMSLPQEYYTSVIEPGAALKSLWGPEEFGGWSMLWKVLTVVLFWKVVFDFALKDIEGVSGMVSGIKGFGEKAGQAGLTMAADQVPLPLPGVNGEKATLASILPGGSYSPNRYLSAGTAALRQGRDWNSGTNDSAKDSALFTSLRAARTPGDARTAFSKTTQDALAQAYERASDTEKKEIISALQLAQRNSGFTGTFKDGMSQTELLTVLKQTGGEKLFKSNRPPADSPNPTVPAAAPEVTVEGDKFNITQGETSFEINVNNTTSAGELGGMLNGRGLNNETIGKLFSKLPKDAAEKWNGLDETDFQKRYNPPST